MVRAGSGRRQAYTVWMGPLGIGARVVACATALAASTAAIAVQHPLHDPFAFMEQCAAIAGSDLDRLRSGQPLVRSLPGRSREVATSGARRVAADGDRLVAWVREIGQFKRGPMVESIGRFSSPPQLADLDDLSLGETDLESLRDCRSGSCDLKLTAAEIVRLRKEIDAAGREWRLRVQPVFRQLVLDRVRAYLAGGHASLGRYDDGNSPESLAVAFSSILARSPCVHAAPPALGAYLEAAPRPTPGLETFLYWSKERMGGQSVISATEVVMVRVESGGVPGTLVAGRQLFATHYLNGSLNVTGVIGGNGAPHYLIIVNRSRIDVVQGLFGGLTRVFVERRLRSELSAILDGLARRLESGLPAGV
jgi:hypothetical protein